MTGKKNSARFDLSGLQVKNLTVRPTAQKKIKILKIPHLAWFRARNGQKNRKF
jgi:hypothetical protein